MNDTHTHMLHTKRGVGYAWLTSVQAAALERALFGKRTVRMFDRAVKDPDTGKTVVCKMPREVFVVSDTRMYLGSEFSMLISAGDFIDRIGES